MQLTDHVGRKVDVPYAPKRIISICPAVTETLFALGLDNNIVGRTKYCIFPKHHVDNIAVIGGTKEVHIEKIMALQPDLILAEKEENTPAIVAALEKIAPVFVLEVQSIQDAYRFIQTLGQLTNTIDQATAISKQSKEGFATLTGQQLGNAAYVIWRKPYMVAGATTFINDILVHLGFHNPFAHTSERYPAVTVEQFKDANLDYLLLASEPFPYAQKHIQEFQAFLPNTKIILVDGEMFWYGAKMIDATHYLSAFLENL